MPTYPLATTACTVSAAGISAPTYADILSSLQASFRLIYGEDAYLEADSQDGQLLAIFARALHDANMATIAAYNSYSPQTAVGVGLSSAVRLNHMVRASATNSQVNLTLTGIAGTTVVSGVAGDASGNRWLLPELVVIPPGGTVIVTATAEKPGAVPALIGTVTAIITPTAGWQAVTNATAAATGLDAESDAQLRRRQEISPALPAYTVLTGLKAALAALTGVSYVEVYENDTGAVDSNGLPAHSVACVVSGGVAADIAATIYRKKAPGVATHGTTTVPIVDVSSTSRDIKFYIPTAVPIKVGISLTAGAAYTTAVAAAIKQSIVDYINAMSVGEDLVVNRLYTSALLYGAADSESYKISTLQAALAPGGTLGTTDVVIAFNERATAIVADITITVL